MTLISLSSSFMPSNVSSRPPDSIGSSVASTPQTDNRQVAQNLAGHLHKAPKLELPRDNGQMVQDFDEIKIDQRSTDIPTTKASIPPSEKNFDQLIKEQVQATAEYVWAHESGQPQHIQEMAAATLEAITKRVV